MQGISLLKEATDSHNFGGKNANLAKMLSAGLPVPDGLAIGLNAFDTEGRLLEEARNQLVQGINKEKLYAVRSSALAEDAEGASWAGQFETFLDIPFDEVAAKVEECHNSAKNRAKAYATDKELDDGFQIAVVVQEMLKPEYAGVLFTKDPVSGSDIPVTEYVEGLGEELVSGRADPKRVVLDGRKTDTPFDAGQLINLAKEAEQLFGVPQDIEWVWAHGKMWLVQARPITVTQKIRDGLYLGEPQDLFYWGPSRTQPMYMSDFMAAAEKFFIDMAQDPEMPTPPRTLVLFHERKMVWLSNAQQFADFTEQTFEAYERLNRLDEDMGAWRKVASKLADVGESNFEDEILSAWLYTEFAEFALYGAEAVLAKRLSRFDDKVRQEIWGAFTVPDKQTFLARIDDELAASQDPVAIAQKYPWIEDGYDGVSSNAQEYFKKRLEVVGTTKSVNGGHITKRHKLEQELKLTKTELSALTLARRLAEFMDDRKAWMMQTRCLIKKPIGNIKHGWFFKEGKVLLIGPEDVEEFWERYVDFKASSNVVSGIVASNAGRHFVNGEVAIVTRPADIVEDGKIVVVPSTSPSYVPLMRKAKALVTDHGGMMSHAAIVAREFNLPCIVGTKQATKVLKDGDKVVLDLVRGEVNK